MRWHLTRFSNGFLLYQSNCIFIFFLFGFKLQLFFPKIFFSIFNIHLSLFVITLNLFLSCFIFLNQFKLFCWQLFSFLLNLSFLSLKWLHYLLLSYFKLLDSFLVIFWDLVQSELVLRLELSFHLCPYDSFSVKF